VRTSTFYTGVKEETCMLQELNQFLTLTDIRRLRISENEMLRRTVGYEKQVIDGSTFLM
jgi:hypothetical protein